MQGNSRTEQAFLLRLTQVIEANLTDSQFGVKELAKEMGMSRSSLHRQLKKINNETISHFICVVRLKKAMELLQENSVSAAEIAYNVGFSSPAYFSRCFHDYYGFPPGEVKKRFPIKYTEETPVEQVTVPMESKPVRNRQNRFVLLIFIVLLVVAAGIFAYQVNENGMFGAKNNELSIIVLPFDNLSDNPGNASFADGIREDILNNLYWITALRVVSRTSAEQFRVSTLSSYEIAKKMGVHYVLEGSVRRDEEKVRISVQLIDATKREDHLWSANFDRELDDIIGVQDEIALQVASKLKTVLSEKEKQKIEKISTQNPKAYEYFLQARFLHHKTTSDLRSGFDKAGVQNCLKYYEMAIAEDENFAEAYAGLANAWLQLSAWKFIPSNEGFLKGYELSLKALELDPECAEAHCILGTFLIWGQRKLDEGSKKLQTSIHFNPNFAYSRQVYAQYLMISGPIEEARKQVNRALNLEPNFWVIQNLNAWIYYFEEKYEEALEACAKAHDYNPNFSSNQWLFVLNFAKLGEGEKMKDKLISIAKRYSNSDNYTDGIEKAFNEASIDGLFNWMIDVNKNNPIEVEGLNGSPFFIAWWNAIIGNEEEAVLWLEKNMQQKYKVFHYFNLIATNPDFDILRDDPRFLKIVDDIGLTPYHNRKAK